MDRDEALKLLKGGPEGVKKWNEWMAARDPKVEPVPDLGGADLGGHDLDGVRLSGASLMEADLSKANLDMARLNKAFLMGSNLSGARLIGADLRNAKLMGANVSRALLAHAFLTGATAWNVDLRKSRLANADLRGAELFHASFKNASVQYSDLSGGDLAGADLRSADLTAANLGGAHVTGVRFNRWARYRGIRLGGCYGSPRFERFARDQDWIEEFRSAWWRKPLYLLWLIFADCGRSFLLWAGWSVVMAIGFACIFFYGLGPEAFDFTALPKSLHSMIYYSVVTFTTLGFGDITPKTTAAAYWVMAEVSLGYIMLGGLISIMATKLARRS